MKTSTILSVISGLGLTAMIAMLLIAAPLTASAKEDSDHDRYIVEEMLKPHLEGMNKAPASPEDMAVTDRVKAALGGYENVAVNTVKGIVTLMGTVPSFDAKQKALSMTRDVDGVRTVKDQLMIVR